MSSTKTKQSNAIFQPFVARTRFVSFLLCTRSWRDTNKLSHSGHKNLLETKNL